MEPVLRKKHQYNVMWQIPKRSEKEFEERNVDKKKLPLSIAPSQTTVTKALINGGAFASSEETFLCREKKQEIEMPINVWITKKGKPEEW